MVFTRKVQEKLRTSTSDGRLVLVDIPQRTAKPSSSDQPNTANGNTKTGRWTSDEHQRFMVGLELFPAGPWRKIAEVVGTRNERQTMTHAQKYWMKITRHRAGLRRGQSRVLIRGDASDVSNTSAPVAEHERGDQDAADAVVVELEPLDASVDYSVHVSEEELFLPLFRAPMEDVEDDEL